MCFFKSFQRPECNTSDSADITHTPPDNSPLGKAVSMQRLGPSCQQIAIAEIRGLNGRQISLLLNQNTPTFYTYTHKPKVWRLLLRTPKLTC